MTATLLDLKNGARARRAPASAPAASSDHGTPACWRGRSLLSLEAVTAADIRAVLGLAAEMKSAGPAGLARYQFPVTRTIALLFEKPSLRTRVSFEAGIAQLGGTAIHLSPADIGLGSREPAADVAAALSRWVDAIAVRVFRHATITEMAENATIPVINALSDLAHPCQAFADLLTIQEQVGTLGNDVTVAYLGDGNNVLHSLMLACAIMGIQFRAACPDGCRPNEAVVLQAEGAAALSGATVTIGSDPKAAVDGVDVVYTDVWTSMGEVDTDGSKAALLRPYQINSGVMRHAKPGGCLLHCLPAHKGEEITAEVFDAHRQTIFDQAENRLHTQRALLRLILA